MKKLFRLFFFYIFKTLLPEIRYLKFDNSEMYLLKNIIINTKVSEVYTKIYNPYEIRESKINSYSYISKNSKIYNTEIGKFCSIGPNFQSGMGLHPTSGLSTSPMFYSKNNLSNGISISPDIKFSEHKPVKIGNDVFIGANVIILDGVTVGNGAVIGAGAVVVNDIPDFAIAVGVPAKVVRYRFNDEQIKQLKNISWWNWNIEELQEIERYFYDIDKFINKYKE